MFRRNFLALLPGLALIPFAARAAGHLPAQQVTIKRFKFDPEIVEVTVGHSVEWTNMDGAPHTATADDGSFHTGTIKKGKTEMVKFDTPGTYTYFCKFHRKMKATVIVT